MKLLIVLLGLALYPATSNAVGPYVNEIRDKATFTAMANAEPTGMVQSGSVLKFLIDNRSYPATPTIYYINGNYCDAEGCPTKFVELHRTFGNKLLKKEL